ncbi:MAG: hypothetical protein ABIB11_02980, partial [Candidatus Omnitrophota bacterium]
KDDIYFEDKNNKKIENNKIINKTNSDKEKDAKELLIKAKQERLELLNKIINAQQEKQKLEQEINALQN